LVFDIPTEVLRHTITMTQLLMIGICLNCLFVIMRSLLNAEKHFIHPALATLLYNVLMIACIVIGSNYFSVYAMVYGSIAGMGSQLLYLLILFKKKNIDVKISFSLKDKNVRQSFRLAVPIMGLEALWGLYYFVDGYFASHLSTGSVSSLNYASTVFRFPGYLVGTSLGAALLPTFSEAVQQDQMIELKEKFSKAFRMLTILSMMFSGIFILTSRQIVSVLYQRGAFDALAVQRTSGTLQILSYGFIFVMMYPIVYRLFNALGHNKILMTSFLVGFVLKIGVYYGFLFRYGMQGIVLSMLVGFLAILGIPLFYLNRNVSLLSWTEVSVFFRSIGVLGACLLLNLILPSLLVLIVFTGVMIAINKNEFVIIVNQILSRFGIRTQNP
jgi:putative peptidoglycan lipid II flippase